MLEDIRALLKSGCVAKIDRPETVTCPNLTVTARCQRAVPVDSVLSIGSLW